MDLTNPENDRRGKRTENRWGQQKTKSKTIPKLTISIITLNTVNTSIKRQRLSDWIKGKRPKCILPS